VHGRVLARKPVRRPQAEIVDADAVVMARVISDCHFRKAGTEYDRKPGIKWLSCTAKRKPDITLGDARHPTDRGDHCPGQAAAGGGLARRGVRRREMRDQGRRGRGLTRTPRASFHAPPHHMCGVFCVHSHPLER
jgi:hypothetical protein